MSEDRRVGSTEALLLAMGNLQSTAKSTHDSVVDLNVKVGIQNGRITKLETKNEIYKTVLTIFGTILTVVVIPALLVIFAFWIQHK